MHILYKNRINDNDQDNYLTLSIQDTKRKEAQTQSNVAVIKTLQEYKKDSSLQFFKKRKENVVVLCCDFMAQCHVGPVGELYCSWTGFDPLSGSPVLSSSEIAHPTVPDSSQGVNGRVLKQ